MMTEVTTGFAKSHASDRRAGLHPCAFAIGAITSRIFQVRSLSTMGKSYSVRRESAASWFVRLNLPESKPPESGLQTSRPTFSDSNRGTISRSRSRAGDRVISLKRVESGQVPELGNAEGFGDLPWLPVGAADVADLSLL